MCTGVKSKTSVQMCSGPLFPSSSKFLLHNSKRSSLGAAFNGSSPIVKLLFFFT